MNYSKFPLKKEVFESACSKIMIIIKKKKSKRSEGNKGARKGVMNTYGI